jgi:hypothetical protein
LCVCDKQHDRKKLILRANQKAEPENTDPPFFMATKTFVFLPEVNRFSTLDYKFCLSQYID